MMAFVGTIVAFLMGLIGIQPPVDSTTTTSPNVAAVGAAAAITIQPANLSSSSRPQDVTGNPEGTSTPEEYISPEYFLQAHQNESFDTALLASRLDSLTQIVSALAHLIPDGTQASEHDAVMDQSVAAGGNPTNPFAALNAINRLSGVTISDSVISASSLPDLSQTYVSAVDPATGRLTLGLRYATGSDVNWYYIDTWGDSLTAGSYDGNFPDILAALIPNSVVYNNGVGGQTSIQVGVRQGSIPTTAVVTGNGGQIPTSGGVTISFKAGHEPVTSNGPAGGVNGTIAGVYGTVTYSNSTTTFTRLASGSAVSVTSPAAFSVDTRGHDTGTAIIWVGRNDISNPNQVLSSIAAMVESLPSPKRYLILSLPNATSTDEIEGTALYETVTSINASLAATYPDNYLDIRSYLVQHGLADAGITPTAQDTIDIAHDVPPSSLHLPGDPIHLNAAGNRLVAQQIANWIADYNDSNPGVVTYPSLTSIFSWPSFPFRVSTSTFNILGQGVANTGLTGVRNTSIGFYSLNTATSSSGNTAIGYAALQNDTGGGPAGDNHNNTAVGMSALRLNTYGHNNSAFGGEALDHNTTGSQNVAFGSGALFNNTIANGNVALGYQSMFSNLSGSYNFGIGYQSLFANTTGNYNIGIGTYALAAATSTSNNLAIGFQSLYHAADPADKNVGVGNFSLTALTHGVQNTGVGYEALSGITTGSYNTAVGHGASGGSTGSFNLSLGVFSLASNINGSSNVALGTYAGSLNTYGSNNIFIGHGAGYQDRNGLNTSISGGGNIVIGTNLNMIPNAGGWNQLNIGNLIFGTGLASGNMIATDGRVAIGTTTPYSRLTVWGSDTASSTILQVVNSASTTVLAAHGNGNVTYSGLLFQSSDERLKSSISSLDATTSLALVTELNPVSYTRIDQPQSGTTLGFIAQEVQRLFPDLVISGEATALTPGGTLILNYTGLIAPLTKALQALAAQIAALTATISALAENISTQNLSFTRADGDTVTTRMLCIDDLCVTKTELAAMLTAARQSPSSESTNDESGSGASYGPPTISIQGENPSRITVGSSYQDLGAIITGPRDADRNLGIRTYLDGVRVESIALDTSAAREYTIEYVVENDAGAATSSRAIIVGNPQPTVESEATPVVTDSGETEDANAGPASL